MKRVLIICAIMMVCAFFTTQAVAQQGNAYNITTNYGIIVDWVENLGGEGKGFAVDDCQQVGSITINQQEPGQDTFYNNQIIVVELLNSAKLCKDIGWDYDGDGLLEPIYYTWSGNEGDPANWNYRVRGRSYNSPFPNTAGSPWEYMALRPNHLWTLEDVFMPDKIIIELNENAGYNPNDTIVIGHDGDQWPEDDNSSICVNHHETIYTPKDPNLQVVQVTYHDQWFNAYTGDSKVATVKEGTEGPSLNFDVALCNKNQGESVNAGQWPEDVEAKTGIMQIPLCFTDAQNPQSQDVCECKVAPQEVCFTVTPNEPFVIDEDGYDFLFTTNKVGVGIDRVRVYGADLQTAIGDFAYVDECNNKQVSFNVFLPERRTYYVVVTVAYDCPATAGPWIGDLQISRDFGVCQSTKKTYTEENIYLADFVDCEGQETASTNRVFPYAPAFGTGWWEGIVLTNPNDDQITVNMSVYEADGDKYTAAFVIPAKGLIVGLLDNPAFFNPQAGGADATFGDEPFWMVGESLYPFYSFYMVGDGTQAQGYLPYNPLKF
ncbi:MAG: hypothetical protein GY795_45870 [Desulfobacterales bacterium]|nr:hypothetical protein [Desulfobacterales bacterium]